MEIINCAPLTQCKVLHFLRHAEAESNAAAHQFPKGSAEYNAAYEDARFFDSVLSERGEAQCAELKSLLVHGPSRVHYDMIVCSPLRRALQTACRVFEDRSVPWIAVELAREYSHGYARPCDSRRPRDEQATDFAHVDFTLVPQGEDLFTRTAESEDEIDRRCGEFLNFLIARPETSIAVVSHTGLLTRLFSTHLPGWRGKAAFGNCELRSVIVRLSAGDEME